MPSGTIPPLCIYWLDQAFPLTSRHYRHLDIKNIIRPTAIGKKNFLFIGHPEAGWRSAVIYSILGSCHRHKINPALYLRDVLSRLPNMQQIQVPTITPKAWTKAHPQAIT